MQRQRFINFRSVIREADSAHPIWYDLVPFLDLTRKQSEEIMHILIDEKHMPVKDDMVWLPSGIVWMLSGIGKGL